MTALLVGVIVLLVVTPFVATVTAFYRCELTLGKAFILALTVAVSFFACWGAALGTAWGYFLR